MPVDADQAAHALTGAWEGLFKGLPYGWSQRADGALAVVTTVELPPLNGVWVDSLDAPVETVAKLLDEVAGTGLPHCLQVRPGAGERLAALARERGMTADQPVPLMALKEASGLRCAAPAGLQIRKLAPAQAPRHAAVAAQGFGTEGRHMRRLVPPALLEVEGVRCYIGESEGTPVVTGLGYTAGDAVGVFNIATPSSWRRRGYGAAVTARVIADGCAAGAAWAWLQSSPDGYSIYERLGFRTLERWQSWLAIP